MYKRFHAELALVAKPFHIDLNVFTRKWVSIYETRLSNRGKADAVKFCKELNTVCERYALRQNITPIPWTKSDKDGFPMILGPSFKKNLRSSDPRRVVFTLSVMRSCESLRLPISKDLSSITDPSQCDEDVLNDILLFIPGWVKRIKRFPLKGLKYNYSVKNGPNGHATHSSDTDISAVMRDPELFEAIQTVQDLLKDPHPMNIKKCRGNGTEIHSKISQNSEKSGKTRTYAIVDYYSQHCLRPLHKCLMNTLGSMVSDGTFSHQNVGKFAQQSTKDKSYMSCCDLTAFTDRFPREIQRVLLYEYLKDDDLSNSLWTLLAKRSFTVKWSGEIVTYSVGQPMGALSSWPLCALAHHLVVEYSAHLAGISQPKELYRLIGDDVIITDKEVANNYKRIIQSLGVELNLSKTVTSSANSNYSGAEIAKQLYLNGTCFTPLTPGFVRDLKKPYMFNTCMKVLKSRYEFIDSETPSMLIDTLFRQNKRKLVWLLSSNPISGIIEPGNPGYNDRSPWISTDVDQKKEDFHKMVVDSLLRKTEVYLDNELDQMLSGEDPWKDPSQPPPSCLRWIKQDLSRQLTKAMERLGDVVVGVPPETLVAEFDFIPDPYQPYMARKETRQRRMSSMVESLFDYEDNTIGIQLDW